MNRCLFLSVLLTSLLVFVGCATTFSDYEPKSTDEEEIKTMLAAYFEAWNNHDADTLLSMIHEDAQLMTGRERRMNSKQEYAEALPDRFEKNPKFNVGSPKMKVNGDEATINAPMSGPDWRIGWSAKLVRENGKWYIFNSKY